MKKKIYNLRLYIVRVFCVFICSAIILTATSAVGIYAQSLQDSQTAQNSQASQKQENSNSTEDSKIIYEIKGDELARYANTGKSMDNMRPFCYGWKLHADKKTERASYVKIVDGNLVFQAQQDEFLPGGYIFKTGDEPGLIYTLKNLEPGRLFKIAYVINIDPLSINYTNRLMNFEFTHSRKNISIKSDELDSWGDKNEYSVPKDMLGKDLQIVFNVKLQADSNGEYELHLINYSAAHYPLFVKNYINIDIPGNNAPFKVTIKAVQFLKDTVLNGVHEINYNVKTPEPAGSSAAQITSPPANQPLETQVTRTTQAIQTGQQTGQPAQNTNTHPETANSNNSAAVSTPTGQSTEQPAPTQTETIYLNNRERVSDGFYTDEMNVNKGLSKDMLIIIITVGVLIVALVAGGVYFIIMKRSDNGRENL